MGIIGVVAALTIPNLNGSTNDMEKVAKVKKVYANLTEAFDRATAVYRPIETWFVNDDKENDDWNKRFTERFTEFLKLSTSIDYDEDNSIAYFSLVDGTYVYCSVYYDMGSGHSSSASQYDYFDVLKIDIDGKNKGKNK